MMEANRTERGKTRGTILGMEYIKNFTIRIKSRSFPANSAIKSQTVCKINIKKKDYKYRSKCNQKCFEKVFIKDFHSRNLV